MQGEEREEAQGALLLVSSTLLQTYDAITEDAERASVFTLEVEILPPYPVIALTCPLGLP